MKKTIISISIAIMAFAASAETLFATTIDLRTFSANSAEVTVDSANGIWATLREDPDIFDEQGNPVHLGTSPVTLTNSSLAIPNSALSMSFDYELVVPANNEDYFDFYFGDTSLPQTTIGGIPGIYANNYLFDLTIFQGLSEPMIFALGSGFQDFGSSAVLTISNLEINTSDSQPIPEPGTIFLLGTGIAGMAGFRKQRSGNRRQN